MSRTGAGHCVYVKIARTITRRGTAVEIEAGILPQDKLSRAEDEPKAKPHTGI